MNGKVKKVNPALAGEQVGNGKAVPSYVGRFPAEDDYYAPLLVISNHPPEQWEDEQKRGWEIYYLPFPRVPAAADECEVFQMALELSEIIKNFLEEHRDNEGQGLPMITMHGEFSLCALVYERVGIENFVFPTSERNTTVNSDGSKTVKFKFVQWRHFAPATLESDCEVKQ